MAADQRTRARSPAPATAAPRGRSGLGYACLAAAADGIGIIDCDGGAPNVNLDLRQDHNTTPQVCVGGPNVGTACTSNANCPSSSCNLGNGGQICLGGPNANAACTSDAHCPLGQCAFPDDNACTTSSTMLGGSISRACPEGQRLCMGGSNTNKTCLWDGDCPGGTCTALHCRDGVNGGMACSQDSDCPQSKCGSFICRGGSNAGNACVDSDDCPTGQCIPCNARSSHALLCNSPVVATPSGTYAAGDMGVTVPLTMLLLAANGSESGVDQIPCTSDDTPSSLPATMPLFLSTGTSRVSVFDANNTKNRRITGGTRNPCTSNAQCIAPEQCRDNTSGATCVFGSCSCRVMCGAQPCVASLTGSPFSCASLATSTATGAKLGGGFPALDTSWGDVAITFNFVGQ